VVHFSLNRRNIRSYRSPAHQLCLINRCFARVTWPMGHEVLGTVSQCCHKYFIGIIDIFVKTPRIIFKVLNFKCIISKSIVFTCFLLASLRTKWNIKFCKEKTCLLFSHWKNRGSPNIRALRYFINTQKVIQASLFENRSFTCLRSFGTK
jgi:hypothetical protein